MTRLGGRWPLVLVASCVAVGASTQLEGGEPGRVIVVFWFFLTCPGLAVIGLLGVRDRLIEVTLAVALSIALDIAVALTMVLAGIWSPTGGLAVLIGISLLGAALQAGLQPRGGPFTSTGPGAGATP
jgi:hypothetical protein